MQMSNDATDRARNPERFKEWEAIALSGCFDEALAGSISREKAMESMKAAVARHYPECVYAFGHGSSLTGGYKVYSDLDLIIFNPDGANWEIRREIVNGRPVEFTTYSTDTVDLMVLLALHTRVAFGLLAGTGEIIVDNRGDAKAFQERLTAMSAQMPLIDRSQDRDNVRTKLFSILIDLRKDREAEVAQAIVLTDYQAYIRGITLVSNIWLHRSRHFVKNRDLPGSGRITELHSAIAKLMDGNVSAMIDFTEDLIEDLGGGLWSGRTTSLDVRPEYLPVIKMLMSLAG
jgi:predicted nucleotidyltransferase